MGCVVVVFIQYPFRVQKLDFIIIECPGVISNSNKHLYKHCNTESKTMDRTRELSTVFSEECGMYIVVNETRNSCNVNTELYESRALGIAHP